MVSVIQASELLGCSLATVKRRCLPALLPDKKGKPPAAEFSPAAMAWIKLEWGCTSKPDLADVYQRCMELAPGQGWIVPSRQTVQRRINALPMWWKVLTRDGQKALADMYPAQERDYSELQSHDLWSSDGHKMDMWCKGEDGKPYRPIIVVWYDQATRYVLGWAVSKVENSMVIRLALRNAIVNSKAIPKKALLDNGRGYTSKLLTGGTPNRYRFTVREEDPHGILTQMGVDIGWATPGHGQSKPIERFWGSFTAIAKMRQFAGAYCGNNPTNRPEECDPAKAVPEALVFAEIEKFMERYNNRVHRGHGMNGLSPRAQMDARLQNTPIRQPTEAQIRGLLLAAEAVKLAKQNPKVRKPSLFGTMREALSATAGPSNCRHPVNCRCCALVPMCRSLGLCKLGTSTKESTMPTISPVMENARHDLIACVIDYTQHELVDCGIDPHKSAYIAVRVADNLMNLFGGQNITFPIEYRRKLIRRDAEVLAAFNGTNVKELAIQHKITERGMRKLLERARTRQTRGMKA